MEAIVGSGGESHSFATTWLLAPIFGELERPLPLVGYVPHGQRGGGGSGQWVLGGLFEGGGSQRGGAVKATLSVNLQPSNRPCLIVLVTIQFMTLLGSDRLCHVCMCMT